MLFRMFNRHHAIGDMFEGGGALAQRSHRSFHPKRQRCHCPIYSPLRLVAKLTTDKSNPYLSKGAGFAEFCSRERRERGAADEAAPPNEA
jgi:hypothetical protein